MILDIFFMIPFIITVCFLLGIVCMFLRELPGTILYFVLIILFVVWAGFALKYWTEKQETTHQESIEVVQ